MAFAETSLTILAPISEGSIEDLALNVQMVTNDQDDHQVAMNNERNKCMMDSSLEKVAEISRAITLVACNDMEIPTDGHGNVDSKTSEDQNGILI